jgi:glycosyltransferase involved in cell wall biosynthesis
MSARSCTAPASPSRPSAWLEAMATGLPVVATSRAHQGLAAVPGRHLLVADHPHAFADAVTGLLESPHRARDLGRAARAFVCAHHAWPAVLGVLDDVLRTLAAPGVRQGARP